MLIKIEMLIIYELAYRENGSRDEDPDLLSEWYNQQHLSQYYG